jgi:hypothetical protein
MQRRPYLGRRPRRNSRANVKIRVGIAASALVLGGGAAAVVVASHGPAPSAAQSASFNSRDHQAGLNEWGLLNSAINGWGSSMGTSMTRLASVNQPGYSQAMEHGKSLDVQRGVVLFASRQFLIIQSKSGVPRLWVLSGSTKFENVANSTAGSTAMTASTSVSKQATQSGLMIPEVNTMAGDAITVAGLLTPTAQPQTITVQVAGTKLTVTVTISRSMATMSETATTPTSGSPVYDPTTTTMSAWSTAGMTSDLARGDLVLVAGSRSDNLLHASIILYAPLTVGEVGGPVGSVGSSHPHAAVTPSPSPSVISGTHY